MTEQSVQKPDSGVDLASRSLARPLNIVLLASSLLFLGQVLQYIIQRPFIKTTVQLAGLHSSVNEHYLFPVSLMAGFLGLVLFQHDAWLFRLYRMAFLSALAATGLLAPIFLFGAVALGICILVQCSGIPANQNQSSRPGLSFLILSPILILVLLFIAPFEHLASSVYFSLLIMAGLLTFGWRKGGTLASVILAGIFFMLPFSLEASTRSMVARVKGDQRTLTIALETYYLDHNAYPPHTFVPAEKAYWRSTSLLPTFRVNPATGAVPLTTPVAYLTALPQDLLRILDEDRTFVYYTDGQSCYIIVSAGPNCVFDLTSSTLDLAARQLTGRAPGAPYATLNPFTYDPSNGTRSSGDVYRTKQ